MISREEYINIIKNFTPCSKIYELLYENVYLSNDKMFRVVERKFRHIEYPFIEIEKTTREALYPHMNYVDNKKIEERKKWKKFGSFLNDNNINNDNNSEEVFMEYNPRILYGKQNKKLLYDYIEKRSRREHSDDIKFIENEDIDYNISALNYYKSFLEVEKKMKSVVNILDEDFIEKIKNEGIKKKEEELLKNKVKETLDKIDEKQEVKYLAPHLRKNKSNRQNNQTNNINNENNENNEQNNERNTFTYIDNFSLTKVKTDDIVYDYETIKLSNLPNDFDRDELIYFIKDKLKFIKFKLNTLTDRNTGKYRNFCFIKFNDENTARKAFDIIDRIKYEYNILSCEWSKRKN